MRDQQSISANTVTTIVTNGHVYPVRKMTHAIMKNTGANVIYIQWTEEDSTLTATNGFPLESNETISFEFRREGQPYAPDVKVFSPLGTTIAYVFE